MELYGLHEISALEILSETGTDLSKWQTVGRFISWLNPCPNSKISGGKPLSSKMQKKEPNAAAKAFRMAAQGVRNSQNWMGHFFRRMKTKGGHKYDIITMARKIAIIYYKMVRERIPFNLLNYDDYRQRHQQAKIASLQKH